MNKNQMDAEWDDVFKRLANAFNSYSGYDKISLNEYAEQLADLRLCPWSTSEIEHRLQIHLDMIERGSV